MQAFDQQLSRAASRVPDYIIPPELVQAVREQRVIPFVGAGISAAAGLPAWEALLREIAAEVAEDIPYDEIARSTNGDLLQIAEYLYLRSDRSVGPLRLRMTTALQPPQSPVSSTPHVELVNLGAAQIYTTNFDELTEITFKRLGHGCQVVALPKDIAQASTKRTQVVKYHGDLRHDPTLVLTESSYYTRLDFESPLDLKFRSDLLGRSLLFMGYSFRDLNIRVIWFKLMQMMKDVPEGDRPTSYMVRIEPNPVLELLYFSVGLKTIVLDPKERATGAEDRTRLVGSFLRDLAIQASPNATIPGHSDSMFLSAGLIREVIEDLQRSRPRRRGIGITGSLTLPVSTSRLLAHVAARRIPLELASLVPPLLGELTRGSGEAPVVHARARLAINYLRAFGPRQEATIAIANTLIWQRGRDELLEYDDVPWELVWASPIPAEAATSILKSFSREIDSHRNTEYLDDDLAYMVDIAARIRDGSLVEDGQLRGDAMAQARSLIDSAAELYPSIRTFLPASGMPDVHTIREEIAEAATEGRSDEVDPDDIPF